MRKIFISAGHSPKKPGAAGNGYREELLAIELRDLIVKELTNIGVTATIDSNQNALAESIIFFKKLLAIDSIALDIHWNAAANPAATGTETLVPGTYSSFEYSLAAQLSEDVSTTLGIRKRGANGVKTELESHHGRLGWMRLTGENILMEVCFITNPQDMKQYQANKLALAKKIALTLKSYTIK